MIRLDFHVQRVCPASMSVAEILTSFYTLLISFVLKTTSDYLPVSFSKNIPTGIQVLNPGFPSLHLKQIIRPGYSVHLLLYQDAVFTKIVPHHAERILWHA